jgi:hypothetical protein
MSMNISMGLRVLACVGCCLACLPRAAAQANASPPATQPDGIPPLSAQGDTLSPAPPVPSEAPPPSAAPSPAPPPAALVAPAVSAPPPPAAHAPPRQGHDLERPPPRGADDDEGHLSLRLSLGLQAALLGIGSDLSLRRPSFASFDIGYAPCTHWVLLLRAASWLSFGSYVSQFIGAGFSYLFSAAGNMFVTGALGIALHEGSNPQYEWGLQGLAAQLDLGQQWPVSATSSLGVGAHFEVATHWLGTSSLTDFGVGLFVSAAYR